MTELSRNLRWMLRHLVGTRIRFIVLLMWQCLGFIVTILHLGLTGRQVCDLAFWGLITPLLFLITLRRLAVELERSSVDDKRLA